MSQFTRGSTPSGQSPERQTLSDFVHVPGVYPVGRLDFDSEGLLLLTDDGRLQHRLAHPSFEHPRTYWVQVEGTINDQALRSLRSGLAIQDYTTRPCHAESISEPRIAPRVPPIRTRLSIPTSWLELTLTEGKNRQVRRMTAAVGFPTLRLIRVGIGPLRLGDLAPGAWRPVSRAELRQLLQR